jgi:hypothetical protein
MVCELYLNKAVIKNIIALKYELHVQSTSSVYFLNALYCL